MENHINKCSPTSGSTLVTDLIPPIEAEHTVARWLKTHRSEKAAAEKAAAEKAAAEKAVAEKKQEEKKKKFKLYQKEWYQKNKQRLQAKQRAYEKVYRKTGPIKKSSYTGIEWQRGVNKWRSTYKGKYIGIFEDEMDAVESREMFKDL